MLRLLGRRLEIRRNSCSGFSFGTILTGEFLRLARESPKLELLRRVHRLVFFVHALMHAGMGAPT